tara:strand:- start:655 stop:1251 length:597 start_codon:yes stop_codon:yes gene_type:complete
MASLFDTLQAGAYRNNIVPNTKKSRNWFSSRVRELGKVTRKDVMNDPNLVTRQKPMIGDMMMYVYDPKGKFELPYFDIFPLTIMVGPAEGGFYGLNLHYLSPMVRAEFLDELMKLAPAKKTNQTRLARLRYDLLQGVQKYREFKPCFKHYLMGHVKSRLARVPMTEWEIAVFLPTEEFKNVSKQTVWRYSRDIYRIKK